MPGLVKAPLRAPFDPFFGRKKELDVICDLLANSGDKKTRLLTVAGPAGVGKSSLINRALELHSAEKCFKLSGKFENHRQNAPYSAFRQVFASWSRQILLLPDEEFDRLKEEATAALQTNISAVTSVFNELEVFFSRKHLSGNKYKADSHQIKARFFYFLKKFLKSITGLGYRLIIFLDDLQWADKASFLLLEELVQKQEISNLTFITAYRKKGKAGNVRSERIAALVELPNAHFLSLRPLNKNAIGSMLPPQWKFSKQDREAFCNYLWLETSGNPFKIKEIIGLIQREKSNFIKPQDPLFWEALPRIGGRKNSVTFISKRLRNMPFHHQQVIGTASCLGYRFEGKVLVKILSLPPVEVRKCLQELVRMDFLIKKRTFHVFAHDTIFSAANSLLSNVEKHELHKKLGLSLLATIPDYEQPLFFKAVNHLNLARELQGSRKSFAAEDILLNLQAAKLAIRNSAFETALSYLGVAEKLFRNKPSAIQVKDPLLKNIFKSEFLQVNDLQFQLLFGNAEVMFLLQKFEPALGFARKVLKINTTRHHRLQAALIKIRICSALIYQRNIRPVLLDGLNSLEQVLAEFNIVLPSDPEVLAAENLRNSHILSEKAQGFDENFDFSKSLNPDKEYQDLLKLITSSMTFIYYMDVQKNLNLALKTLLMSFSDGYAPVTPVIFSASFLTSSYSRSNRTLAHKLGRLSLKMIEKEPYKRYSHVIYYIATLNFFAWENHYRVCIQKLKESVQLAYEEGEPHYAAFCSTNIRLLNSYRGKNLQKHLSTSTKFEKNHHVFFISSSDDDLANYLSGNKQGFEEGNFIFSEDLISESKYNKSSAYHYNLALQKLNYISGHLEAALEAGENCENLKNVYSGFQIELEHFFFYSLTLLKAVYLNHLNLAEALEKVEPKLEEFRRLSTFGSGNYLHKVFLLEAEIAKCQGDFEKATLLYDKAIAEAKQQGFHHHAAIAAELAFEYYSAKERHEVAGIYLQKALKFYTLWGALAKVAQLRNNFSDLLKDEDKSRKVLIPATQFETINKIINRSLPYNNDGLPELANYLLSLILRESSAKKAAVLLLKNNSWELLAIAPEDSGLIHRPLKDLRKSLPVSVLNYSIKKGEKMLMQNLSKEVLFADDPYLQKEKPLNLSVFPVRQSSKTVGIIYLEDCQIYAEAEKQLFRLVMDLASTSFANAVFYENNHLLNQELKLQERNRIAAVIESQEKERQRIARELHDSLGQLLALTKLQLSQLQHTDTEPEKICLLSRISSLIDESCEEVRNISHDLMPPDLKEKDIVVILENLVKKSREANTSKYRFNAHDLTNDLSEACKFTLYRVLQEILQNIIKHAAASQVNISLTQTADFVNLLVEDNGNGFDTNLQNLGLGLKNIHSRIKLLDGYLDIDSSINNGTVFNVSIPLKA